MKSKPYFWVGSIVVAVILLITVCMSGFLAGSAFGAIAPTAAFQSIPFFGEVITTEAEVQTLSVTPEELDVLFEPFWQAWTLVEEKYVDQPVDHELMMQGAISGMMESLGDQHTSYLDPEMFEEASAHLEGEEYEGIGAWVDTSQDYLTIISPMPGSPAEEAGLKPNDKIIAIDGEDMTGIDGELVRKKVLGPNGSIVVLKIFREGVEEPFDVEVTRSAIIVPSVDSRMLEENIAYIQLYTFGNDTAKDLKSALKELMRQDPDGLILDLRNNGGGYLETAIDVVSQFIGDGVVMIEEYGDGTSIIYDAKRGGLATDIPMVVLINEGSASASEIVAGAVQDRQRGELVGMTSFGKGSVQNYTPLVNEQGAVRVTVARWLTPEERQIHEVGLQPDYEVDYTEEDYEAGIDPQLLKAIEILKQS